MDLSNLGNAILTHAAPQPAKLKGPVEAISSQQHM